MRALLIYLLLCLTALMAFAWVSTATYHDALVAQSHYCDMVSVWHRSDGRRGWPNFQNLDCSK